MIGCHAQRLPPQELAAPACFHAEGRQTFGNQPFRSWEERSFFVRDMLQHRPHKPP
ncbi:hypothetical protein AWB81_08216 [Caballeronia arationis]|nr:hypothetical protein AWB81_08216 [Caballeronia arationis]